jgi:hypothetical protein
MPPVWSLCPWERATASTSVISTPSVAAFCAAPFSENPKSNSSVCVHRRGCFDQRRKTMFSQNGGANFSVFQGHGSGNDCTSVYSRHLLSCKVKISTLSTAFNIVFISTSAMRFSTLSVCSATGFSRFFERTTLHLIAFADTGCFHNKTTSPAYQLSDFFPACGTFLDGRIGHGLLSFELQATTTAFIFIREHNLCSFLRTEQLPDPWE